MFFPFLVILPGLIAISVTSHATRTASSPSAITASASPSSTASTSTSPAAMAEAKPHGIIPQKVDPLKRQTRAGFSRRAGLQLRPGHPGHALPLLPDRHPGAWSYGPVGQLYVRHGRQCHGVQHRVDLRHLPELHPQERQRRTLPLDGPRGYGGRHTAFHCRGVRRHPASTTSWTRCNSSSPW